MRHGRAGQAMAGHGRAWQGMAGHDVALQGMQGVAHTAGSYHSYESSYYRNSEKTDVKKMTLKIGCNNRKKTLHTLLVFI